VLSAPANVVQNLSRLARKRTALSLNESQSGIDFTPRRVPQAPFRRP
jgi:hypothetical protein